MLTRPTAIAALSATLVLLLVGAFALFAPRGKAEQSLPAHIKETQELLARHLADVQAAPTRTARILALREMAEAGRRRHAAGDPSAANFIRFAAIGYNSMNLLDEARSHFAELTDPSFSTVTRADAWRWLAHLNTDPTAREQQLRTALAQIDADNAWYLDIADNISDHFASLLENQGRHTERAALYESQLIVRDAYADEDRKAWITLQVARAHAAASDLAQARNWYDRFITEHPRFTTGGVSWIQFRIEAIRLNGKLSQYDPKVVAALEALWNDPATTEDPSSLRVALLLAVPNRSIRSRDEAWAWSEAMLCRALGLEAAGTLKPYLERPENHSFAVMSLERQLANLATADAQWVEPFESLEAARLHQRLFPDGANRNRVRDRLRNGP